MSKDKTITAAEAKYYKEQIIASKQFRTKKDLLRTLLKNDRQYSVNEVNKIIEVYLKRRVK